MNIEQKALSELKIQLEELNQRGISSSEPIKNGYAFSSDLKINRATYKLLYYFGKKGVTKIIQGENSTENYNILHKIIFGEELFSNQKTKLAEPVSYIGTDESGKGDYFGPLVIAAAFIDSDTKSLLPMNLIKDSKLISDEQILLLAPKLRKVLENKYDIVLITPKKYNELYNSFKNLNRLLAWGHATVIENLLGKVNTKKVISDKFGDEKLILNSLKDKGKQIELIQLPKAEQYFAVAIASILAREKFLHWFINVKSKLGIELPKGASNGVTGRAKEILKKDGMDYLSMLVKLHFKTTKSL
ncbi:MAG TPA: ribonuclease HIII [Ignavibacteriaceae bacterium]|nr:ribonuclease HIII [Ignavibacteriaceae bacterium]